MNEYAMLHIPDSQYCFPTGKKELVLRLRVSREDRAAEIWLIHARKYEFHETRETVKMQRKYTDRLFDYYEIRLQLSDVRFAYVFRIDEGGKTFYYSEDGLTETYNFAEGFYSFFQMPYINQNDLMPVTEWMRKAVFYEIFVDRFQMGNVKKDTSYLNLKWRGLPTPKSFAGGDLSGIISRLDYLKELGINALYLTPIFKSRSNHKYDTIDYREIDPQFGAKEDLKTLVALAHQNGIRVILDAVFNHCSMDMAQFQDVLKLGGKSRYFDWFLIEGDFPDPENMNYECFASCAYMPKLNTANEEVQEFLKQIAVYWLEEFQIDGWRLDVSDEVSHDFWRQFRKAVKKINPDAVIIGENWHDAAPYLRGDQYDSIMNYAFTKACLDYFAKGTANAVQMAEKLNQNLMRNTEQANRMLLNLLDSHDTHRFFTEVKKDKDKLLAAVALEMVYPGAPCLYYGTEVCMEGGYDPDSRRCFPWEKETWDKHVWGVIRELILIHKTEEISYGDMDIHAENGMLVVEREWNGRKVQLLINLTDGLKKKTYGNIKSEQLDSCQKQPDQLHQPGQPKQPEQSDAAGKLYPYRTDCAEKESVQLCKADHFAVEAELLCANHAKWQPGHKGKTIEIGKNGFAVLRLAGN